MRHKGASSVVGVPYMKPPPWKKMYIGSLAADVFLGL
jgi:hypothetical protein